MAFPDRCGALEVTSRDHRGPWMQIPFITEFEGIYDNVAWFIHVKFQTFGPSHVNHRHNSPAAVSSGTPSDGRFIRSENAMPDRLRQINNFAAC
jgi:hypothetical protein